MFDLHSATPLHAWPAAALDEIDYGLILLDGEDRVAHINHAGRAELDSGHPLQLNGRMLQPARPQDAAALREALAAARQRGLRRLISLGTGSHRTNVSVVPLPPRRTTTPVTVEPAASVSRRTTSAFVSSVTFACSSAGRTPRTSASDLACTTHGKPSQVPQRTQRL